jgi:hypothetical protein
MPNPIQDRILRALFLALRPICRSLLRAGIGYREFSGIAKLAFVHEASSGFGIRGRQTNNSRVAVMTGISRKETARIREGGFDELVRVNSGISPGAVILQHWFTDKKYTDVNGHPISLSFDEGENSFSALVRTYGGDIPAGAMRAELQRVGAVEEARGDMLTPLKREFVPSGLDDRLSLGLDSIVRSASETLAYNCNPENEDSLRVQQVWGVDTIDPRLFGLIQREARLRLTELGRSFDDYLSRVEQENPISEESNDKTEIGVGLYYYEMPTASSDIKPT